MLVAERGSNLVSVSELKEIQERVAHPQWVSTLKVYSGKWGVFQRWCKNERVTCESPTCKTLNGFSCFFLKKRGFFLEPYKAIGLLGKPAVWEGSVGHLSRSLPD